MMRLLPSTLKTNCRDLRICTGLSRYSHSSLAKPLSANDIISPNFENRNPRNLERLRIAYKPKGYFIDKPLRDFWHKLLLNRSSRHITALVVHYTGPTVLSASSKEWCIRKYLYRTNDASAYVNVARALSQRCLESGIVEMQTEYGNDYPTGEKLSAFFKVMESNGILLNEPQRFEGHKPWDQYRPEKPWEVSDD